MTKLKLFDNILYVDKILGSFYMTNNQYPQEQGSVRAFQENVQNLRRQYNTSSRTNGVVNDSNMERASGSDGGVSYGWAHSSSNCDFI